MYATIIYGAPGSGKSTMAAKHREISPGTHELNRDNLRFGVVQPGGDWTTWKFHSRDEKMVTILWKTSLKFCVEEGKEILITDSTYCDKNRRDALVAQLKGFGYTVSLVKLDVPLDVLIERDAARGRFSVGKDVVEKFWRKLNGLD